MNDELRLLVELQELDSQIIRLTMRKDSVPIERDKLDSEAEKGRKRFTDAEAAVAEFNRQHAEKERQLQSTIDTLKKTKAKLFDVKTNEEYQATLKEIDFIESKAENVEDAILMLLEGIDEKKSILEKEEASYREFEKNYRKQIEALDVELETLDVRIQDLMNHHRIVRDKVGDELLRKYDMVRAKRNGIAVVSVWKEICSGCHMNIPPQLYNDLQRSIQVVACPHCNRIIYWEDRNNSQ
ncbi:MAG: hypothetical protein JW884_07390 [Deltaproteobacteria bacterium]|nr:hypothetical protein [Deltaproteobacteria bacterium]